MYSHSGENDKYVCFLCRAFRLVRDLRSKNGWITVKDLDRPLNSGSIRIKIVQRTACLILMKQNVIFLPSFHLKIIRSDDFKTGDSQHSLGRELVPKFDRLSRPKDAD